MMDDELLKLKKTIENTKSNLALDDDSLKKKMIEDIENTFKDEEKIKELRVGLKFAVESAGKIFESLEGFNKLTDALLQLTKTEPFEDFKVALVKPKNDTDENS